MLTSLVGFSVFGKFFQLSGKQVYFLNMSYEFGPKSSLDCLGKQLDRVVWSARPTTVGSKPTTVGRSPHYRGTERTDRKGEIEMVTHTSRVARRLRRS